MEMEFIQEETESKARRLEKLKENLEIIKLSGERKVMEEILK